MVIEAVVEVVVDRHRVVRNFVGDVRIVGAGELLAVNASVAAQEGRRVVYVWPAGLVPRREVGFRLDLTR